MDCLERADEEALEGLLWKQKAGPSAERRRTSPLSPRRTDGFTPRRTIYKPGGVQRKSLFAVQRSCMMPLVRRVLDPSSPRRQGDDRADVLAHEFDEVRIDSRDQRDARFLHVPMPIKSESTSGSESDESPEPMPMARLSPLSAAASRIASPVGNASKVNITELTLQAIPQALFARRLGARWHPAPASGL